MSDSPGIKSKPYYCWGNMKNRCTNKKLPTYHYYGGRGITLDKKWLTFQGFWDDMGATYEEGLRIERIDNDLGYSKQNCRWATHKEQCNNRRTNTIIEVDGITKTLAQWCDLSELKRTTITQRYFAYGWDFKRALQLKEEVWQAITRN